MHSENEMDLLDNFVPVPVEKSVISQANGLVTTNQSLISNLNLEASTQCTLKKQQSQDINDKIALKENLGCKTQSLAISHFSDEYLPSAVQTKESSSSKVLNNEALNNITNKEKESISEYLYYPNINDEKKKKKQEKDKKPREPAPSVISSARYQKMVKDKIEEKENEKKIKKEKAELKVKIKLEKNEKLQADKAKKKVENALKREQAKIKKQQEKLELLKMKAEAQKNDLAKLVETTDVQNS